MRYLVLDARERPGGAWRDGWASLELFSPAAYSSLPGWPMPPSPGPGNPPARHVVDYLTSYEARYDLPVRRPVRVERVLDTSTGDTTEGDTTGEVATNNQPARPEPASLTVETSAGTWTTRAVINATGTWDRPFIPAVLGITTFAGEQLHTAEYRGPDHFSGQRVLVVGGGNSGAQIAADLLDVAASLHWVTARPPRYLPDDVDGRVLFETATQAVRDRAAGRPVRGVGSLGDIVAVPAVRRARDQRGLVAEPMIERLTVDGAVWPDSRRTRLDAVVWATGFRPSLRHLRPLRLSSDHGHPATIAPAGSIHPVRARDDARVWFSGYGDWTGAASATLVGVSRPARDIVHALDQWLRALWVPPTPSPGPDR